MKRRGGFVLLELLLVVIVIAILASSYFAHQGPKNDGESTYQMSIGRSQSAACKTNRAVLLTSIQMFKIQHPNEAVTTENMQKAGVNVPKCPNGGAYGFTKEGTLVCSVHPDN